jgi:hypothetical protein
MITSLFALFGVLVPKGEKSSIRIRGFAFEGVAQSQDCLFVELFLLVNLFYLIWFIFVLLSLKTRHAWILFVS